MFSMRLRKPHDTVELPQLQALVDNETGLIDRATGGLAVSITKTILSRFQPQESGFYYYSFVSIETDFP